MTNVHPGSKEMYETIAQWEDSSILISKTMGWSRFGILGILGDFVLRHVQGDIVEIGIGESSIFLTELARRFSRIVYHCDLQQSHIVNMKTVDGILDHTRGIAYTGKSDDFFKEVEFSPIALGFIDGEHTYEQAKRDFMNIWDLLVEGGYIFLHDTYPIDEDYLPDNRCGDVYKFRQELEDRRYFSEDLDVFTFPNGAIDVGFTMVRKLPVDRPFYRR